MLNKVMIIGRLGRDPELRYTSNGTPVTSLNIATDESYIDREGVRQERTEWHRVTVFQKQAENCTNYLSKGSLVYVEGSLQTRKWQDQSGQDRYTTEIRAQRVQFLDRRGFNDGQRSEDGSYAGNRQERRPSNYGGWSNHQGQGQGQGQGQHTEQPAAHHTQQPYVPQQAQPAPKPQQNVFPAAKEQEIGTPFPSEAAMDEVPF